MSDLVRSSDGPNFQPYTASWREGPPNQDESLDARRLAMVLRQKRWLILLIAALVVIPIMAGTFLTEKLYRSSALIQVDPDPVQVLPDRELGVQLLSHYDLYMKTQEQVLSGQTLLLRVANQISSESDPEVSPEVERLGDRVVVRRAPSTQAFVVSYIAPIPEVAAKVANLFAEQYIALHYEEGENRRQELKELLNRELALAEERIQTSEKELVAYAQVHNIQRAQPDRDDLADQKLATLAQQVTEAEAEVAAARSRAETLRAASVADFPASLMTPVISDRSSRVLQIEHDLTALRADFGENWPDVVRKRNEIAIVREQLDREKGAALAQAREQAAMDLRTAEYKLASLGSSRTQQAATVSELQSASIQYNILQRQVDTNRKLYEGLLERLRQTSVAPGMALGNVRIIEPARPNQTVASPQVWWNLFLASILGLALGVSVALLDDYWRDSLSTVEDVEHATVFPVLAAVPLVGTGGRRRFSLTGSVLGAKEPPRTGPSTSLLAPPPLKGDGHVEFWSDPANAEAVRSLCASILLSKSDHPPRVLVVTSALPGEGKTTVSMELSRALAESGARTLLVECDLRRSRLGDTFGVGDAGGLSLFLSGHVAKATIHQTKVDKLCVVSAGPVAPNPVALLNSDRMTTFLRDMASSFHFVILDAPPVLPMADARVLGPKADGVVLIIRAGRTSRRLLRRVRSVLDASGARVLGAVLNGADVRDMDSSYYNYYEQHYTS